MNGRLILWSGVGAAALAGIGGAAWTLSLLPTPTAAAASPIPEAEAQAMLDALRPIENDRPVVAIIGINDATETTDYLMPFGILRRAHIADALVADAWSCTYRSRALTFSPTGAPLEAETASASSRIASRRPGLSRISLLSPLAPLLRLNFPCMEFSARSWSAW